MDSVFLKKLLLKGSEADRKCYIYLHSEWYDDVVKLHLKDSSTGLYYKSQLIAKDFEEPAAELEIPLDDFRAECKRVFTSNICFPGFELELDSEKKILKVNKNEQFCIQYLEIELTEADKGYEMLDVALNIIDSGKDDGVNQKTNEELNNLIEDVEQVVREKEEWKQKMLRKFLVLLNTKKEKISTLQRRLEKMDKSVKAKESLAGPMDQDGDSDALDTHDEQFDFDAPTQRFTPPDTKSPDI